MEHETGYEERARERENKRWEQNLSWTLALLVQAFYREKSVNLPLIAKEGFLTVFGPGTCPL